MLQSNPQLELAFEYIRNTNKNIFLTGKAGTGKTTFLHQVKKEDVKRMAVVAPTGVAAINAGGMTIHSFFQLPFGTYLPGTKHDETRQRKFTREKIRLIQSLDLLVIDEISMVRADVLDGIDEVLRRYRDFYKPFGGVQLLMIGDLHQLPPVVKDDEWLLLREHYPTPYFFSSHALRKTNPVAIELKHIYRQSDDTFIKLLNRVRDNKMDEETLAALNSRFVADFQPTKEQPYITLTAHNQAANDINFQKLTEIPGIAIPFKAIIEGDFPRHAYPTEEVLEFKETAQVMFVKNDISREKQYYNGKIGQIIKIDEGIIYVKCPDDDDEIAVGQVEWQNIKYTLNEKTKEVGEEILGTFIQHPLKLAWAITIHKSQGLTFERAIIDAQAAFAHGQVYVALSRCKSFEGIVLRSKIIYSSVKTDSTVKNYTEEADKNTPDEQHLTQSKKEFQQALIVEMFHFRHLQKLFEQMFRILLEHENTLHPDAYQVFKRADADAVAQVFSMSEKFMTQLPVYFQQPGLPEDNPELIARIQKAGEWFSAQLQQILLPQLKSIRFITDNKSVLKAAMEALDYIYKEIFIKNVCLDALQPTFSAQRYLRLKANAELDYKAIQQVPMPATAGTGVPKGVTHPELYLSLKKWRDDLAADGNLQAYEVLPTKVLLEIVHYLPVTLPALKKVKGFGATKSKQFGADIIRIIQDYCIQKKVGMVPAAPLIPPPPPKQDTKNISFDLFQSGKTIDEIAAERTMVRATIEGHLAHFIGLKQLDIFQLMASEKVRAIEEYINENQPASNAEIKLHFGDDYSYGEIKMVQQFMNDER